MDREQKVPTTNPMATGVLESPFWGVVRGEADLIQVSSVQTGETHPGAGTGSAAPLTPRGGPPIERRCPSWSLIGPFLCK